MYTNILWHFLDFLNSVLFLYWMSIIASWWKSPLLLLIVQLHVIVLVSSKILNCAVSLRNVENGYFTSLNLCCLKRKNVCPGVVLKKQRHVQNKILSCISTTHVFLGVADGVGGWRDYGVDPSQFSGTLMKTCERLVKEGRFVPSNPVGVLTTSYYELLQNKVPLLGECTHWKCSQCLCPLQLLLKAH